LLAPALPVLCNTGFSCKGTRPTRVQQMCTITTSFARLTDDVHPNPAAMTPGSQECRYTSEALARLLCYAQSGCNDRRPIECMRCVHVQISVKILERCPLRIHTLIPDLMGSVPGAVRDPAASSNVSLALPGPALTWPDCWAMSTPTTGNEDSQYDS
jgi:hypothetical protein